MAGFRAATFACFDFGAVFAAGRALAPRAADFEAVVARAAGLAATFFLAGLAAIFAAGRLAFGAGLAREAAELPEALDFVLVLEVRVEEGLRLIGIGRPIETCRGRRTRGGEPPEKPPKIRDSS